MFILNLVSGLLQLLTTACYYFLAISYHIGSGIFWMLSQAFHFVGIVCTALAVIGEEFYRFLGALYENVGSTLHYVRSSTNGGIGAVLEAGTLCCTHIIQFFSNTKVYSKLLATTCGQFIVAVVSLIRSSLLLISDWFWWLLTLPKTLMCCFIAIGDFLVLVVSSTMLLLTNLVHNIFQDVFVYTIAVLIVILLSKKPRTRFCALLRAGLREIKLFCRAIVRMVGLLLGMRITLRPRNVNHNMSRGQMRLWRWTNDSQQNSCAAPTRNSTDKLHESQRCVACWYQAKRVLLLPCKHLCLCDECANYLLHLEAQRAHCPLCRSEILQSMSVYV